MRSGRPQLVSATSAPRSVLQGRSGRTSRSAISPPAYSPDSCGSAASRSSPSQSCSPGATGVHRFFELRHPAQLVALGFALGILAGTGLLLLPAATAEPGGGSFLTAAFTATSSI